MAQDDAILNILIRAKDQASQTLSRVRGGMRNMAPSANVAKLAMAGVGGALGSVTLIGARLANEMEENQARFRAATGRRKRIPNASAKR